MGFNSAQRVVRAASLALLCGTTLPGSPGDEFLLSTGSRRRVYLSPQRFLDHFESPRLQRAPGGRVHVQNYADFYQNHAAEGIHPASSTAVRSLREIFFSLQVVKPIAKPPLLLA